MRSFPRVLIFLPFLPSLASIVMFASVARSFVPLSMRVMRPAHCYYNSPIAVPSRYLCSSKQEPDTSIVDICRDKIQTALQADSVTVEGAYDDPNGSHIAIRVVADAFNGKRPVQRQQLVYKAIWEELQGAVHAVDSMTCQTPDEATEKE